MRASKNGYRHGGFYYRRPHRGTLVKVVTALAGHELEGIFAPELATAMDMPVSKLWRDLQNLRSAG